MPTVKIPCTRNISISEQYQTQTYTGGRLAFGHGSAGASQQYNLLLQFSVSAIPAGMTIESATLYVPKTTGDIGSNAGFTAVCRRNTSSWGSSTTWASAPGNSSSGQATAATGTGHSGNVAFDVTAIVTAWYGGTAQYGVVIYTSDTTAATRIKVAQSLGSYITVVYRQNASTFSAASSIIADGSTTGAISITAGSSAYTHDLTLTLAGTTTALATDKTAAQLTSFTVPTSICSDITAATSAVGMLTLTTYSGSTAIGTATQSITVRVPSSVKPSLALLSSTGQAGNATAISWGVYVQGKSKVALAVTATQAYDAAIVSYTFSGDGWSTTVNTSALSASATSPYIAGTGNIRYTVTVTDARGRSASVSYTASNVTAYTAPKLTSQSAARCTSSGTTDPSGTYILASATGTYASISGNNALSITARATEQYTSTSIGSATLSGGSAVFGGGNAATDKAYAVLITATDSLGGKATATVIVPSAGRVINISTGGSGSIAGIAFNGFAENNKFISNLPSYFPAGFYPNTATADFNMDTLVQPGFYDFGTNVTVTNWPSAFGGAAAVLVLKSGGSALQQIAFPRTSSTAFVRLYDGAAWGSWMPLGHRAVATIRGVTAAESISTTVANVHLNSAEILPYSGVFFTHVSTGGLQCNVAGYVSVSGQLYANGITNLNRIYADISKNDSTITWNRTHALNTGSGNADALLVIAPTIVSVAAGDVLRLRVRNDTAASGNVPTGDATYLTAQYV